MECTLTKECVGYISTNYRGKQNAHKVNMTLPILANCPKSLAQRFVICHCYQYRSYHDFL